MSEINLKRKVTLKRKGEILDDSGRKKKFNVLYILVLFVLVGAGIFWYTNQKEENVKNGNDETITNTDNDVINRTENNIPNQTDTVPVKNEPQSLSSNTNELSSIESGNDSRINNSVNTSKGEDKNNTKSVVSDDVNSQIVGSLDEKALQVIRGNFGNGYERKRALGTEYTKIQSKVNQILLDR